MQESPEILFLGLYISVVSDGGVGVEVQDLHLVAFHAPPPPEEAVLVLVVDDCRQGVPYIIIKGGVTKAELEVAPPVIITKNLNIMAVLRSRGILCFCHGGLHGIQLLQLQAEILDHPLIDEVLLPERLQLSHDDR